MNPHRVSEGGSFRVDRRFKGVGRIARATGTTRKATFQKYNRMLDELYEDGYLDILRGLKDGRWTFQEVYQAKRTGRLSYIASDMVLHRSLWDQVEDWLPESAAAEGTRKRYGVSMKALREYGPLGADATVDDLLDVDWRKLRRRWPNSPADWNRMRGTVSRFLSMSLGDKMHPFRRTLMGKIPRAKEPKGRIPDITPAVFWEIVEEAPEHIRPAYVTLAITGMRIGEYLALEDHHLRPHTYSIEVPGTKTEGSADVIRVAPRLWSWITDAVPPPLRYKWTYTHFKRAAAAVGKPDLTLHDLRHLHGMVLSEEGVPEARIQASLRHEDPATTRRYTRQRDRGEAAERVAEILFPVERARGEEGVEGA